MKLSPEEKMDIGRRMYNKEIDFHEAMEIYGISQSSAHQFMTNYKKANNIPLSNSNAKKGSSSSSSPKHRKNPDIEAYMAMSKEELINELIRSKANELRAKKGYEVRGAGANKEFVPLNRPNSKS